LLGSLFLVVGGSTVLNMVIDRDIDARMPRTAHRPLPSGTVAAPEGPLKPAGHQVVRVAEHDEPLATIAADAPQQR